MRKLVRSVSSIVILMTCATLANAADEPATHIIDQKDKTFSKKHIKIKVGETIDFRNSDPWMHNVFSLSEVQSFDLGSYPKPKAKRVVFETEGKVEVECAIHPQMHMVVEVVK